MKLFPEFTNAELDLAKKRIWTRVEGRLEERELLNYADVLELIEATKHELVPNRLVRVLAKERLLDQLPVREQSRFSLPWKVLSFATLSIFCSVMIMPVFSVPSVYAEELNEMHVVHGMALLNGEAVEDSLIIKEGDSVFSGASGMVHLELMDDSRVTLGPNTHVNVLQLENDTSFHETQIQLEVISGRVWSQVPSVSGEHSLLTVVFPEGQVMASQKSSFDLEVGEFTQLQVVQNLVEVIVEVGETYSGHLGQGTSLILEQDEEVQTFDSVEEDTWWDVNVAYGDEYVQKLEDEYIEGLEEDNPVLPGDWLYPIKTIKEEVQIAFAGGEEKEDLIAESAENKLEEAQVLLAQGDMEGAEKTLDDYQDTVTEKLADSDNETLLEAIEDTQKNLSNQSSMDDGDFLVEGHISDSTETLISDLAQESMMMVEASSQKLQSVTDQIRLGDFEAALASLETYRAESASILVRLEPLSLEGREAVVLDVLENKLEDLQTLRVIRTMPELQNMVNLDESLYEDLSLMVLSLRERALTNLSSFFSSTEYDVDVQYEVYLRLKDSYLVSEAVEEQLDEIEEELAEVAAEEVLIDLEVVDIVEEEDPRFVDEEPLVDSRFGDL